MIAGRWWRTRTRTLRRGDVTLGTWTVATLVTYALGANTRVVLETFSRSAGDDAALEPFLDSITLP
jgi:hypothetical protein